MARCRACSLDNSQSSPTYLIYDSEVISSKYLALGSLAKKQERLGIRSVWPQILNEPKSLYQSPSGTSGTSGFDSTELIEIGDADRPVAGGHRLEDCPNTRPWASAAKGHPAQFVPETLGFL